MPSNDEPLDQDQGVLDFPVRALSDEDKEEALDDLEKAALAMGVNPERMTEADGLPTDIG